MRDDESDAIAALQSGDIAGLQYIVERYQLPALRLAYNLCNDRQMAEDAVAESFLAVARHASSYDPTRGFVQIVEWDATSSPLKTLSRSAVPHLHAGRPEALLVVTKGRTTIAIDTDLGSSTIRKVAGSLQPILGNTARQLTR